ncbi:glycoside hydrolase [Nocardia crassostreae]|uniref:glycoside hydrolase n=1 Tax=Nocardia crassostreae TaxID=53428 RepID=UPI0008335258|nr:glycoside hydrolase [Nocardia crassostreae]
MNNPFSRRNPDTRLWASAAPAGGAWTEQAPVPGATSPEAPALTEFQHRLHMAWRAEDSTNSIWFAGSEDGSTWSPPWNFPFVGTSEHPALAAVDEDGGERLYLAWKGADRDQSIYWSTSSDGHKWEDQQILGGAETSSAPCLVVFRGALHAFWRGTDHLIGSDQNLYTATRGDAGWSAPTPLPGILSADSPAIAVLGDRLYLAHRGARATFDDDSWIRLWSSEDGVAWISRSNPPDAYSDLAPALAAHDGRLHLTWKSASGSEIWYSGFDGDQTWQPPARIAAFETACAPALSAFRTAVGRHELQLAWRGSTL